MYDEHGNKKAVFNAKETTAAQASDIDYAWEEAATQYGRLGVKVWICRGEVLPGEMVKEQIGRAHV